MLANLKYFIYFPDAIWNKLSNLEHRGRKIIHTGSKKLPTNVCFLKELGPVTGLTIETLTQVMRYRESCPDKWNRIPLIGSRYENIFNSVTHSDLLKFEGAYTLGSIFKKKKIKIKKKNTENQNYAYTIILIRSCPT